MGPSGDLVNQNTLDAGGGKCQNYGPMNGPRFVGICVFLSVSLVQAQQQDIAPPNLDTILKEITALEQKQKQGKMTERNSLIGQIQSAASNGSAAASFYTQAVEEVQFKGRKDKVEAFIAWKKAHADLLHSKEMQTALLLHLKYLLLSLQRKDMEKPETQLPAVNAYLNDLLASEPIFSGAPEEARGLLDKSIRQSVFAQWLQFGELLPDEQTWESKPGDIPGILEKNLRSIMREKKDPQIIQTWDLEMKLTADRITADRSAHKADGFNTVTRPRLQFKQALDMIVIGQPNRGLAAMISLVRTNPWHPDFAIWVAKIRELVKPASAPQTSPQPTPDSAQ